ncbi:MAG TPA: CAP domain-containing protein [Chthonomonadales bacterium]|nr:CAP domain-containing protein [Chthonomonadales bacterium]
MWWRALTAALIACAMGTACAVAGAQVAGQTLSLEEAQAYLLARVNADRGAHGLSPVAHDPLAARAAQRQGEDMAVHVYVAHWDRSGRLPWHRYSDEGGSDFVQENVYLEMKYRGREPSGPMALDAHPRFTPAELDAVQDTYMKGRPPNDGHRRNILSPYHTHVGIGLARSRGPRSSVIANAQVFVVRCGSFAPLPAETRVSSRIGVAGMLQPPWRFEAVTYALAPPLTAREPAELMQSGSYSLPRTHPVEAVRVVRQGAEFSAELPPEATAAPGVLHVVVWASRAGGPARPVSCRAVVVR